MTTPGRATLLAAIARLAADPSYSAHMAVANALHELTPETAQLAELKIAITRNFTIDTILPVLEGQAAREGFYPRMYLGEYDGIAQDLLDPQSGLYAFRPDFIIVAQWLETLAPQLATRFVSLSMSAGAVDAEVLRILEEMRTRLRVLRQHSNAAVLLNNFVLPPYPAGGILDVQSDASQAGTILRLNDGLRQIAGEFPDVYVVDLMGLTATIGHEQAFDERYWHLGRAPLSRIALTVLGREYMKFIRALRGRARKCLVLDCDNTLWGGVVGEDGISGIKLGGAYPGSCYQAFQREILNLKDRGVILAVCSKNNEEDVREVFRNHPDMQLREEHIATWQVNWDDKVTNLRKIAERLNIGWDAIVFADDSRFECDFVHENLPEVEVLCLGDEPSAFPRLLSSGGYFDSLTVSREDGVRTLMYQAEARREQLRESATSLSDYLGGMQLVATLGMADDMTIPRVAQLTQKTNQFNLTTRRYSESEIRSLCADRSVDVIYMKLRDRISDLGLIGVAILKRKAEEATIDTFLLSCRALGRGAEQCLLAHCLKSAAASDVKRVVGRFSRTPKNSQVADFYGRCGFSKVSESPEESVWEFQVNRNSLAAPSWIQIELVPRTETYACQ